MYFHHSNTAMKVWILLDLDIKFCNLALVNEILL